MAPADPSSDGRAANIRLSHDLPAAPAATSGIAGADGAATQASGVLSDAAEEGDLTAEGGVLRNDSQGGPIAEATYGRCISRDSIRVVDLP